MSHTIELKKVSKFYSNKDTVSTGFSRIDLKLDMGEFVVITGESGSGKSTLLNVISGLDTYEEGEMFVCGEDTSGYRTEDYEHYRKTYIGNIFQDFNLVNSYSVYQNIELSMLLSGKKKSECKKRVKELIELVGLTEYTKTKASRLSGGQKQRVAIARALAKDAPIIVADEPTGNLDSESALRIMEILNRISKDKLVVIVTHNYEQAEPYVTRKLTMHDGKIIEDKKILPSSIKGIGEEGDLYASLAELAEKAPESYTGEASSTVQEVMKVGGRAARNRAREEAAADNTSKGREGRKPKNPDRGVSDMNLDDIELGSNEPFTGAMRLGSQYRLGLRNTFNLPAKFILLLIVYLFITTAFLAQYSSTKENLHQSENLGWNDYFQDQSVDRLVLKKKDKSAFTDDDYAAIEKIDNVKYLVKNDLGLDTFVMLESDTIDLSGPVYQSALIEKDKITYGELPKGDYEIVVRITKDSWIYEELSETGANLVGKEYYMDAETGFVEYGSRLVDRKVKISGVIIDKSSDEKGAGGFSNDMSAAPNGVIFYVSDKLSSDILLKNVAASSKTTVNWTGTKAVTETGQVLYPTEILDPGEAYVLEENAYQYYDEGAAANKKIDITVENMYFTTSLNDIVIYRVITTDDIESRLKLPKEDYDMYSRYVFISQADFEKMFRQGNYQISAFMEDETLSKDTVAALSDAGYTALALKDSLSDFSGGFDFVIRLISLGMMVISFIVLFFIAYGVIRLIMRSRNSYYSTLRILGANRGNTNRILRLELVLMMLIASAVDMTIIYLTSIGKIEWRYLAERLNFLAPVDYIVLFALMLFMSLLIAKRYSRKLFTDSAMQTYREEA